MKGGRTRYDSAENALGEIISERDVVFVASGRRGRVGQAGFVSEIRRERSAGPILVSLSFQEGEDDEIYTLDQLSFRPPLRGGWLRGGHYRR